MILFDDGDELVLRDGPVRVEVQPIEQLLRLGLVCLGPDHLVHSEDSPERNVWQNSLHNGKPLQLVEIN